MLAEFFNKTIVVRRLRTVSGQRKAIQATATVQGTYQNVDQDEASSLEGVSSKRYKAWFDINENIQSGDILTDATSGKRFRVLSLEKKAENYGLDTDHLEVIMEYYAN